MPWNLPVDPLGNIYLSACMASIPIGYLFYALAFRRVKGHWAALCAVGIAAFIAVAGYGMPAMTAALAILGGALFGLWPIAWIVVAGLFMYNLSVRSGKFEIMKNSLASITTDRRMQALLIAFSFGAFLEGCAGFGTPVAISAAVLMGLGFEPIYAAGICLLANTAPVAFGSIGIPILVAGQVSGIDTFAISQMAGRTLPFVSVIIPFYIVILMSGWKKCIEVWPAAFVCGASFAVTQFLTANYLGPMLPDIISSLVSIVCLTIFLKVRHPKENWAFEHDKIVTEQAALKYSHGQVFQAWAPFLILSIVVAAWGVKPIKAVLDSWSLIRIPIPGLHEMVVNQGKAMAAVYNFNILSAAGTAVFFACLFSIPVMGVSLSGACGVFASTVKSMRWPFVTMASILGFAYIMNFSGMAVTLGTAFATTGVLFPFFSPFLGWLGVFMTGSDTSSNALFGRLQEVTATHIGVDPVVTVSANSVGGVCGKMISPQSLAVATAAVGLVGRESDIFRFTIRHSLILTTVIAVLVCLQAYVFTWIIPVYAKEGPALSAAAKTAASLPAAHAPGMLLLAGTAALVLAVVFAARAAGKRK